jgi:hypothetical protein
LCFFLNVKCSSFEDVDRLSVAFTILHKKNKILKINILVKSKYDVNITHDIWQQNGLDKPPKQQKS